MTINQSLEVTLDAPLDTVRDVASRPARGNRTAIFFWRRACGLRRASSRKSAGPFAAWRRM